MSAETQLFKPQKPKKLSLRERFRDKVKSEVKTRFDDYKTEKRELKKYKKDLEKGYKEKEIEARLDAKYKSKKPRGVVGSWEGMSIFGGGEE